MSNDMFYYLNVSMKCIKVYTIRFKCELLVSEDLFLSSPFSIKNVDEMYGESSFLFILAQHNVAHN